MHSLAMLQGTPVSDDWRVSVLAFVVIAGAGYGVYRLIRWMKGRGV